VAADGNRTDADQRPIPVGYRQGVITAISVTLGFSLYFLRFWNFEASGDWTLLAAAAASLTAVSVLVQLVALWRSLQVEDDREGVYRVTLKWFFAGIACAVASVVLATLSYL